MTVHQGLEVVEFGDRTELRSWLAARESTHPGVWVRLARAACGRRSVSFIDLLEEGLCSGWSESTRHAGDDASCLQRFAPRRGRGTTSERNRRLVARLAAEGRMAPAGYAALDLPES